MASSMAQILAVALMTLFTFTSPSALSFEGDPASNVVMTNCVDQNGVKSSEMAYYSGSITTSPDSVVVISTGQGQTQVWEGSGPISATFPFGGTFTITITYLVGNGEYAGAGKAGSVSFSCWRNFVPKIYNWNNDSCDLMYSCNHQAAPASTPGPLSLTGPFFPTATRMTSNTVPSQASPATKSNSSKGLSQGEIAGAIVASLAAFSVVILWALYRWCPPVRRHTQGLRSRFGGGTASVPEDKLRDDMSDMASIG